MRKIKVLILLAISAMLTNNVLASTIDNIEAIDNNTIEITVSSDITFSDINVEGDIKLLKDVTVSFSSKDSENFKKIVLNLGTDLTANTSYSLITILWADWNIDFDIGDFLEWEIINSDLMLEETWLEKINIIDSRTIELYFTDDLEDDTFEFKILSDILIDNLKSEGNNKLELSVSRNLEKSTAYIIMVLTLEDAMGNYIIFDEDLLDLVTPADLIEDVTEEEIVIAIAEEVPEVIDEWNIEEVALNSAKTPETGTATWILIMLAIILNLAFFLRKRFIK